MKQLQAPGINIQLPMKKYVKCEGSLIRSDMIKCCECNEVFEWDEDIPIRTLDLGLLLCDDCGNKDWSHTFNIQYLFPMDKYVSR